MSQEEQVRYSEILDFIVSVATTAGYESSNSNTTELKEPEAIPEALPQAETPPESSPPK